MATAQTTVSESQLWRIKTLEKAAGFPVPKKVRSTPQLASAWISLALESLTEAEYLALERPLPRGDKTGLPNKVRDLAAAMEFALPPDTDRATLHDWLFALGRAIAVPASDKVLQYWQKALLYRNLTAFASIDAITDAPIHGQLHLALPALSREYEPSKTAEPGSATAILIAFSADKDGKLTSALLGIPLACDPSTRKLLPPTDGALPFFNREWLEPPDLDAQKDLYFGTVLDCDNFASKNPPSANMGWPDYWKYVELFISEVTGQPNPLPHLASIVGRGDTAWKIVPWDAGLASKGIFQTYQRVLDDESAPLLRTLCAKPVQPRTFDVSNALKGAQALLGHIDTYEPEKKTRVGFGLEQSQRVAATAITKVSGGQILTVNGPPGTGKTSFLRAVIGTVCVQAALDTKNPPLILATAATNKAVTNIIESFSEVAGPEMQPAWESRWIPDLPSYGWFYPAGSKPDKEISSFMVLRKIWGAKGEPPKNAMTAAATSFFDAQVQKRPWLLDKFLELHRQVLGLPECARDAATAAALIHGQLSLSVNGMHDLQKRWCSCLDAPSVNPAFRVSESILASKLADLERATLAGQTQLGTAQASLQSWNACLGQLREAARLRSARTGIIYAIKKLLFGDKLEIQAQGLENTALTKIASFDPEFTVYGDALLQGAERRQLRAARQVPEDAQRLNELQMELESVQSMLAVWDDWRKDVQQIVELLGRVGNSVERLFAQWVATGFKNSSDLHLGFEEALDQVFRFRHFHMSARYWEARWLASVPAPKDECNNLLWLQRASMLAPVIVATVYTIPKIHKEFGFADLLIFDESGQAAPEIGAASFAFAKRAIVVGDIHQLKPVWNVGEQADRRLCSDLDIPEMPEARSAAVGSIMRTAQMVTAFTTQTNGELGPGIGLVAHYRCRADIIEYCRRLIYGEGLLPRRQERPPNGQTDFLYPPMAWVAVNPKASAQKRNGSWINQDQVNEILRWLRHDKSRILAHYGTTKLSDVVALIAPFRAQAYAMKEAIASEWGEDEAKSMVINTVHALQGAEKPIVAFSLTQDDGNFFVNRDGKNLMNVAVSRAKDCFILFAAPSVLQPALSSKQAYAARKSDAQTPLDVLVRYLNEKGKRLYPREVVIIEAPGKAQRVEDALGLSAQVISTGGHFRRMMAAGDTLTAEITNKQTLNDLIAVTDDLRHIDRFFLATDDDDDGEEIAWHVQEVMKEKIKDPDRIRRMRFYSLAPDDIRQARELALPGIDARRVRANLVRGLFDAGLHQQLSIAGIKATRPQIALLREIDQRSSVPGKWQLKISGQVAGKEVTGFVTTGATHGAERPLVFPSEESAQVVADHIPQDSVASSVESTSKPVKVPRYPASTTAQALIAAYQRYGWAPQKTMDALKALYLGHRRAKVIGIGTKTQPTEGEQP